MTLHASMTKFVDRLQVDTKLQMHSLVVTLFRLLRYTY